MTVGELKDIIREMEDDMEVRLAMQPSWPFEYDINDYVVIEGEDEDDVGTLYLTEGHQIGYLPKNVCDELGW